MSEQEALRYDKDKLRYDLLPTHALASLAEVYTFGAVKYSDNNWRKGMAWGRCFASCLRHLFAWWRGEDIDKESGLPHLSHAAWNIITLMEYQRLSIGLDNREKEGTYDISSKSVF